MDRLIAPKLPRWLERMVPFRRYRVDVGGVCMHVMEQGEGVPVLMLHGNPSWGFLYRKVAAELAGQPVRCIMPDLIGLGFSDKPEGASAHTLEQHIAWMSALVEELALERAVVALQDWGGPIGLGALAAHPELRAALLVTNTVVGPPKPGFRATTFHRFARLPIVSELAFRALSFPQCAMTFAQGDKWSITGSALRGYLYPLRSRAHNVAPLALARMVPNDFSHPSIAPLERCLAYVEAFDGPSEIVWGDRDPVLGRVLPFVTSRMPRARVTRTAAGHFLQEEVPGEIAAAILRLAAAL